jgi:hypothetical protein
MNSPLSGIIGFHALRFALMSALSDIPGQRCPDAPFTFVVSETDKNAAFYMSGEYGRGGVEEIAKKYWYVIHPSATTDPHSNQDSHLMGEDVSVHFDASKNKYRFSTVTSCEFIDTSRYHPVMSITSMYAPFMLQP